MTDRKPTLQDLETLVVTLTLLVAAMVIGVSFWWGSRSPLAAATDEPAPIDPVEAAERDEALLHDLRVEEARLIVEELYPNSGFLPYVETLISTHERLETEHGEAAQGFADAWWWSLVYGGANFELRVGATAPGNCAGPMDVKHSPLILDPVENIEYHCREMLGFYKRGVRGIELCKHVFYPAAPRDWGGGRFAQTHRRHQAVLAGRDLQQADTAGDAKQETAEKGS